MGQVTLARMDGLAVDIVNRQAGPCQDDTVAQPIEPEPPPPNHQDHLFDTTSERGVLGMFHTQSVSLVDSSCEAIGAVTGLWLPLVSSMSMLSTRSSKSDA